MGDMHISRHLNLDGSTLVNLEILSNSSDGGRAGSLLAALEHCKSAQGKRLFTSWVCAPLRRIKDINQRYVCTCDLVCLLVCLFACLFACLL